MESQSLSGYILIIGSLGMVVIISSFVVFVYLYQRKMIRKQKAFDEIEKLMQKQEMNSTNSLIEEREAERKRIAEDLHDNLGSLLGTLRMYSDLLVEEGEVANLKRLAGKISDIAVQTATETRRIAHELDSGIKLFGLKAAIDRLVEAVTESHQINATATVNLESALDDKLMLNLYRIVQELINNTLKHAHASEIRIEMSEVNDEYVSLIYEDDGIGFDHSINGKGMGLRNIQSRTERFKGTISFDSAIGRGATCIIEIPILKK